MSTAGCRRCGNCCLAGGPALHGADWPLIEGGALGLEDLITIRAGELALAPPADRPEPVRHEFLKIRGTGGTWACVFYDQAARACGRYASRPLACRVLDCRNPAPLLALAGQDLLTRFSCLAGDDPLCSLIREHEALCPCPDLDALRRTVETDTLDREQLAGLEAAVNRDLLFRNRVASRHDLSLEKELFAFGRPLFQLLTPLGISVVHDPGGVRLLLQVREQRLRH